MSEVKFTPGPWRRGFKNIGHVTAENGAVIAKCERLTSLCNMQSNAHLIAAAPDLYQALSDLIETLQKRGVELDCMSSPTSLISLLNTEEEEAVVASARAALAKARGES